MVVSFVLPIIGTSGGIDVVYKYAELLAARGHDVCVYKEICAENMHRYRSWSMNIAHQLYYTCKSFIRRKVYAHPEDRVVWKLSDRSVRDGDVIIATAWPTSFKVARLSERKGKKFYFIQGYETWDNSEIVKESYLLPMHKIVVSNWINGCLKQDLGIGPFPVVYNGLDTGVFHRVAVKRDTEDWNFLMLNHTMPQKGVEYGIKVFENVRSKYPNCKLRMFGMCDNSNLPDYVEYSRNPPKDKLVELYSMSDFFIFPSIEDGWGLTPLEAMACGCIVVGTSVGFVTDLGEHENNMMISLPRDTDKMSENIEILINNQGLRDSIKKEMAEVIHKLDWNESVASLENLLYMQRIEF